MDEWRTTEAALIAIGATGLIICFGGNFIIATGAGIVCGTIWLFTGKRKS